MFDNLDTTTKPEETTTTAEVTTEVTTTVVLFYFKKNLICFFNIQPATVKCYVCDAKIVNDEIKEGDKAKLKKRKFLKVIF